MAAAAIDLLSDDTRHEAMAAAGRKTAQLRFCSTKIIPLYAGLYERILEEASAAVV